MIVDALISADPVLKIAEAIVKPKQYLYLTDDIKTRVEMSTEPVSSGATSSESCWFLCDTRSISAGA